MKRVARYALAALFLFAGAMHFRRPEFYVRMMPPALPYPSELVAFSGVCEMILGVMLCVPSWRRYSRWAALALLIAVFPANLQMALHPETFPEFSPLMLWLRLPLQALLMAWVWYATRMNGNQA